MTPTLESRGRTTTTKDTGSTRQEVVRKAKPSVKASGCAPLTFAYEPSPDGIDSNLLILFHGLGDTERPFALLGKRLQKNVPQTATLSVRGGHAIPLMEDQAWSYWDVWNAMGEEIDRPNPSSFLEAFRRLIDYLITPIDKSGCGWTPSSVDLFGFAHGATAALEGVMARKLELGSLTSVCGELLSYPNASQDKLHMPVLMFDREEQDAKRKELIQRPFSSVRFVVLRSTQSGNVPSMPQSEREWGEIMQFWAKLFRNRSKWEREGEVMELSR